MSDRIKELAKQATTIEVLSGRGFDETQYTERFSKEKFAELIVRECFTKLTPYLDDQFIDDTEAELKQHFGVE